MREQLPDLLQFLPLALAQSNFQSNGWVFLQLNLWNSFVLQIELSGQDLGTLLQGLTAEPVQ